MRLISQNNKFDFPYEISKIELLDGDGFMGKVEGKVFVRYNNEEERILEIEKLRYSYSKNNKIFRFS